MTRDQLLSSARALLDLDASGSLVPHGIDGLAREIIEGFIAALSPQEAAPGAVGVKKLDWVQREGVGIFDAASVLGTYRVDEAFLVQTSNGLKTFLPSWRGPFSSSSIECTSLDAAKTAAQADYDQRIRSALTVLPSGQNETGGEVEGK